MIFKTYSNVKNDDKLESENILNYVRSELGYAKACWSLPLLEKRIYMNYKRLKNFVIHIHLNDSEQERKNIIKQYITRVIAIIFKYPAKNPES